MAVGTSFAIISQLLWNGDGTWYKVQQNKKDQKFVHSLMAKLRSQGDGSSNQYPVGLLLVSCILLSFCTFLEFYF